MKLFKSISIKTAILGTIMVLILTEGCKKFVQVPSPANLVSSQNVYSFDPEAIAVLNGIYSNFSGTFWTLSPYPALSADELTLFFTQNITLNFIYTNNLNSNNSNNGNNDFWTPLYSQIYVANAAIAGLQQSSSLTPLVKQQLMGEAEFCRAWFYFYLVNMYGDVPLALTTDYKANAVLARTPAVQVYRQIIADLTAAQSNLSKNYLDVTLLSTTSERVRPTYWAATALLARVYLYYGNLTNNADGKDYSTAATEASKVILNSSEFSLAPLNNVFLANNSEAIWQIQSQASIVSGENTNEAPFFIITSSGTNNTSPVGISPFLLNAFEPGDQRKTSWIDTISVGGTLYYFAYKYKNLVQNTATEYETVLRLGEQYLILAEAEADQNDPADAVNALNEIRNRAGLANYVYTTPTALMTAILHERQVELFTEFGARWFDLKRTGNVNAVMKVVTPAKGGLQWNPNQALYPIPLQQIQEDVYLKQNPGY
jgi:hypothetical protein